MSFFIKEDGKINAQFAFGRQNNLVVVGVSRSLNKQDHITMTVVM